MARTDINEALLNNSYDYDATSKTLTETWENSFSYLYALQKSYIKYEEFFAYSSNESDDPSVLQWTSTRDRKTAGHLGVNRFGHAFFDIDYDMIGLTQRERYRESVYYNRLITPDDFMYHPEVFRLIPIVLIDNKMMWDYNMRVSEDSTTFILPYKRDFVISPDRTLDPATGDRGDIIYLTHKIQVLIVENAFAYRFMFKPGDSKPVYLDRVGWTIRLYPDDSLTNRLKSDISDNIHARYNNLVVPRTMSAYWHNPAKAYNSPAATGFSEFTAIDKRFGTFVSPESSDGLPEFYVQTFTGKDPTTGKDYSHMETISGTEMINRDVANAQSNIHIPTDLNGIMFCALQICNDFGKLWYENGTMIFPMEYNSSAGYYTGKIPWDAKVMLNTNPNLKFYACFFFIKDLTRVKFTTIKTQYGDYAGYETKDTTYLSTRNNGGNVINDIPAFALEKEVTIENGIGGTETIRVPNNMPIPVENMMVFHRTNRTGGFSDLMFNNKDVLTLHYPNIYTWDLAKVKSSFTFGDFQWDASADYDVFYFYHEDNDHRFECIFDFYYKYLYEMYPQLPNLSAIIDMIYFKEIIPTSLAPTKKTAFLQLFKKLCLDYNYKIYNYGDIDYTDRWLKLYPNSNPEDYKIRTMLEWVNWDPETLHRYVLNQHKLGTSYYLFCNTINMRQRARRDTLRELSERELQYVFIQVDGYGEMHVAYEAVQDDTGTWVYKKDTQGNKIEVNPNTETVYVDCGSAIIPNKSYRWNNNSLPGREPEYVFFHYIKQFTDKDGNPETRYVFSMNNIRPYPYMLDARVFVNGLMVVDVYQERKLFLDYFYIPAQYFDIKADGSCDDFIEIEVFPSFEVTKKVRFDDVNQEISFLLLQPDDYSYYTQIDPTAVEDHIGAPITDKIAKLEEVYIKPTLHNAWAEAYYGRTEHYDSEGNMYYEYENKVYMNTETLYKNLSGGAPYKWYFWDGYRFIWYDETKVRKNIFPTAMDLFFRDGKAEDPDIYQVQQRYTNSAAIIKQIYDEGEFIITDRDSDKNPHVFTRLTKFTIKPAAYDSPIIGQDTYVTIYKKPISYEIIIDNQDDKDIAYVVVEIPDKHFNYDASYIRLYVNGRLLPPEQWKFVYSFDCPRIYIMVPITLYDKIFIDVAPYRYKHVYHQEKIDPLNQLISLKGYINKPFDIRYYDVYVNGRKMSINNVFAINPWTITFVNMLSSYDLDIYEKERDWEYYGLDYTQSIFTYTLDELIDSGLMPEDEKYKTIIDMINSKKDPRLVINPNLDVEEKWRLDADYREWAEIELFYYNELLPKAYMNPDRVQFNNVILGEDYTIIDQNYTIDPIEDTDDEDQKLRRVGQPMVVMLDPDLALVHPESVEFPDDAYHTVVFTVGHGEESTPQKYLDQDISDQLNYDSNI